MSTTGNAVPEPAPGQRPTQTEKQILRLSVGLILNLIIALLAVWIALRSTRPKAAGPVTATEFVLVDGEGRTRATLAVNDQDEPFLLLQDAAGTKRAKLLVTEEWGSGVTFFGKDGRPGVSIQVSSSGRPNVNLTDAGGMAGGMFRVDQFGEPTLELIDGDSVHRVIIGGAHLVHASQRDGTVGTYWSTGLQEETEALRPESTGPGSIVAFGEGRELLWRAP